MASITVIPWINRVRIGSYLTEVGPSTLSLELVTGLGGKVRVQTTADGTATSGVDFLPLDREVDLTGLTGGPGQRFVSIPLTVLRDARIEGEETIGIRVTPLTGYAEVESGEQLLTLRDEPLQIYPVVDSSQLLESGQVPESVSVLRFTLIRQGQSDSSDVFQVRYRVEGREDTSNGILAARSGVDYRPGEGVVTFGPGVAEAWVEVTLLNDTEADGPRGLVLQLEGSPQFPKLPHLASSSAWVTLADDERAALFQQADLRPFLLGGSASLSRGPDGNTRLVQATRVFELLPSGLPDLSFGGGTGQLSDPTGTLTDWDRNRFSEPHTLADGRCVFLLVDRIVRWTARGEPDPSFGNGSGSVPLPEPFARLVHLAADGTLTLVTGSAGDPRRLRRILADGTLDPGFVVSEFQAPDRFAVERTSAGHFWLLAPAPSLNGTLELRRMLPDGRPDPSFAPRTGVTHSFGLDALDRAYFAVDAEWIPAAGSASPVAVVRFLPDGRLDEGYRPARPEVTWVQGEVAPDGGLLGSTSGLEFLELNPAGDLVWQWQYPEPGAVNPSATREPDGRVRASAVVMRTDCESGGIFGPPLCWDYWITLAYRISREGGSEQVYSSLPWIPWTSASDLMDAAGIRWVQRSWMEEPATYERSMQVTAGSKAGVARLTQVLAQDQPIHLPIQRAGTTADAATVRGRAFPWQNGRWDAQSAVSFEVPLPAGVADADLELELPTATNGRLLTEWLVRLESASGTELSPLNESRLWILAHAPEGDELRLVPSAGPDTPHILWMVRSQGSLQTSDDLSRTAWNTIWDDHPGAFPLGPNGAAVGWDTEKDPGPRFFRVVR